MEIEREHLTLVLNALFEEGVTQIPVEHPCEEIGELFRIDLEDHRESTVRFTQGAVTYRGNRDDVRRAYGEEPYEDLPGANEYVKAAVAGGLVDFENREAIETYLDRYTHPDLAAGHDPVMIGYDTNLFGFRVPEVLGIDPVVGETDGSNRPSTNGYVLTEGVKEELDWHYKHFSTRALEDAFGPEFDRLDEQPAGANRQGFLGLYEFRHRTANRAVDIVPSGTGDEEIVEAYAEYDTGNRKRVLLLSNDYGFIDLAREQELRAQHVSFPVDMPRSVSATWTDISNTLYVMAILFGVLKLPKVTLYGVWDGKTGMEWQREQIDVGVRSPVVEPRLERDRHLVHQFKALETP